MSPRVLAAMLATVVPRRLSELEAIVGPVYPNPDDQVELQGGLVRRARGDGLSFVCLEQTRGELAAARVRLSTSLPATLGRHRAARVVLVDRSASREHGAVALVGDGARLSLHAHVKKGSTFVRGLAVPPGQTVALALGDTVTVGELDVLRLVKGSFEDSARESVESITVRLGTFGSRGANPADDPAVERLAVEIRARYDAIEPTLRAMLGEGEVRDHARAWDGLRLEDRGATCVIRREPWYDADLVRRRQERDGWIAELARVLRSGVSPDELEKIGRGAPPSIAVERRGDAELDVRLSPAMPAKACVERMGLVAAAPKRVGEAWEMGIVDPLIRSWEVHAMLFGEPWPDATTHAGPLPFHGVVAAVRVRKLDEAESARRLAEIEADKKMSSAPKARRGG